MAIIDVDIPSSWSTGDSCVRQEDLVSVGLSRFERVGKPPRLLQLEVAAGETLRRCAHSLPILVHLVSLLTLHLLPPLLQYPSLVNHWVHSRLGERPSVSRRLVLHPETSLKGPCVGSRISRTRADGCGLCGLAE